MSVDIWRLFQDFDAGLCSDIISRFKWGLTNPVIETGGQRIMRAMKSCCVSLHFCWSHIHSLWTLVGKRHLFVSKLVCSGSCNLKWSMVDNDIDQINHIKWLLSIFSEGAVVECFRWWKWPDWWLCVLSVLLQLGLQECQAGREPRMAARRKREDGDFCVARFARRQR